MHAVSDNDHHRDNEIHLLVRLEEIPISGLMFGVGDLQYSDNVCRHPLNTEALKTQEALIRSVLNVRILIFCRSIASALPVAYLFKRFQITGTLS